MDEGEKNPICFCCVHLQNTQEKEPDTNLPIYECFMFKTKITVEHYAVNCNNYYNGAND